MISLRDQKLGAKGIGLHGILVGRIKLVLHHPDLTESCKGQGMIGAFGPHFMNGVHEEVQAQALICCKLSHEMNIYVKHAQAVLLVLNPHDLTMQTSKCLNFHVWVMPSSTAHCEKSVTHCPACTQPTMCWTAPKAHVFVITEHCKVCKECAFVCKCIAAADAFGLRLFLCRLRVL